MEAGTPSYIGRQPYVDQDTQYSYIHLITHYFHPMSHNLTCCSLPLPIATNLLSFGLGHPHSAFQPDYGPHSGRRTLFQ
jgi:hypothetical protein